jgi:hypothetical protein
MSLAKRDERGARAFDDLAMGLQSGAISRGNAIKLAGAALVASTLGLFASQSADAQEVETAITKKKCENKKNGNFCKSNKASCKQCCKKSSNRPKACCGSKECNCCKKNQNCNSKGQCK